MPDRGTRNAIFVLRRLVERMIEKQKDGINNLRYADDTVIIAESNNQLQQLMDTVVEESEAKGLFLNSAKSFTMVFSKSEVGHTCKITGHGNTLEQVNRFVYLGSLFTSDGRCEQDVQQRIAIAKLAFTSLEKVRKNRNINIQLRCRFLKCYVWSTLLYGSEAWTLSSKMVNKLEATEMSFLRRMQRISYTEFVTNAEVLRRANTKRKLLSEMVNRQVKFFGHVMRKEEMEKLGNYRLCRRQQSSGLPEGNLPDVPAKDERKDANRTDPPDKREMSLV